MKDKLVRILAENYGYSKAAAEVTAADLLNSAYPDIAGAVRDLAEGRGMRDIRSGGYSVRALVESGTMTYPAALVFIDWLRRDPKAAKSSLEAVM